MIPRSIRHSLTLALLGVAVAPAAAAAQVSGGVAYPSPQGASGSPPAAPAPAPAPAAGGAATVTDSQFVLNAKRTALLGRALRLKGRAPAAHAGRPVTIERYDARGARWVAAATTVVAADGSFDARWLTDRSGALRVRATSAGTGATAATASSELVVTVHEPAPATWYGPGFFGRPTACGVRMSRTLLGVAHRTLKCGTPVALLYRGRSIVVPVVDRGPFTPGVDWDLTSAAAKAIGFAHNDRVGAVRLR